MHAISRVLSSPNSLEVIYNWIIDSFNKFLISNQFSENNTPRSCRHYPIYAIAVYCHPTYMNIHYMLLLSQHTCLGTSLLFCNIKTWCQPFIILVYCNPAAWISRNTENIEALMIYCRHLCQRILWSQIIQIECCQINLSNLPKQ